ncbi:acyltransferase family protein [Parabacteroides sp.]
MKAFQLSDISRYRGELMGISTILILICHSVAYIDMYKILLYVLSFGEVGVDLFLFLSGMGLWYSLRNRKITLKHWYFLRYKRILVPYLFICIPITFIRYEYGLLNNMDISYILRFISTIQFWINHNGVWFIAALIPLYLVAPGFYKLLQKYGSKAAIIIILLFYIFLFIPRYWFTPALGEILSNVQFVLVRATCFVLGMWMGTYIEQKKQLPPWLLLLMLFAGIIAIAVTKHMVYCYFFFCLPLLYIMCICLKMKLTVRSICSFFGNISLESYLFNGSIPVFMILIFNYFHIPDYRNIVSYGMAIVVGTFMSVIFNRILKRI